MFVFGSNSKAFKESKSDISFSLESLLSLLFSFSMFCSVCLSFVSLFLILFVSKHQHFAEKTAHNIDKEAKPNKDPTTEDPKEDPKEDRITEYPK